MKDHYWLNTSRFKCSSNGYMLLKSPAENPHQPPSQTAPFLDATSMHAVHFCFPGLTRLSQDVAVAVMSPMASYLFWLSSTPSSFINDVLKSAKDP